MPRHQCQFVMREHGLDGIEMLALNPAKEQIAGESFGFRVAQQQLRYNLVSAGKIQQVYLREIDGRYHRRADIHHLTLNRRPHRRASGTRDEIGIQVAHRAAQHGADIDQVTHGERSANGDRALDVVPLLARGVGS